ncbi:Hypothetical predicted protein [Paramuricea clavata]|uniref:Uncharacterized protein n=1 Tax=Paramuricea clavata TaxID=317549 RepID=A0A7D9EGU9_PARCT|nr:Hypothetical predicted protein [Paramuricea clavata]
MAERSEGLPEISCYIHAVSPVKKSNGSSYINCDLQTETQVVRAVCFEVGKKQSLESLANQKSPVKIRNYTISKKYGREDVVITRKTNLIPTVVHYDYQELDKNISISTISHVAGEQLVRVKGEVQQLSSTKTVVFDEVPVKKQQCFIVDPSGFIKLVLYGKHADTLEEGKVFSFNRVRVKITKNERYVNTPKNESECVISPDESFTEALPSVETTVSPVLEGTGEILGVTNISKTQCCCSCNKKVFINGNLATCESCKMVQKARSCKVQWYLRLYIEVNGNSQQRLRLTAFNDTANKLLRIGNLAPTATHEEFTQCMLNLDPLFISYDIQTNKLINVDIIDI